MSSRQLRRLQKQKNFEAAVNDAFSDDRGNYNEVNAEATSNSSGSDDEAASDTLSSSLKFSAISKKKSVFLNASSLLVNTAVEPSDSDEQSDTETPTHIAEVISKPILSKPKNRLKTRKIKEDVEISPNDLDSVLLETAKSSVVPSPPSIPCNHHKIPLSMLPKENYSLLMKFDCFDPSNNPKIFHDGISREEKKKQQHWGDHNSVFYRRKYWLLPVPQPPSNMTSGLYMETSKDMDGKPNFVMKTTRRYIEILEHCREVLLLNHDPTEILNLCSLYPYHVDLLLYAAEILIEQSQSFSQANIFIRNAILALQSNFSPSFSPFFRDAVGVPQVLMDSRDEANAVLFKAIFLYIHSMGQSDNEAIAYQLCKLAIAMDLKHDICRALLLIDSYALASHCYVALLHFSRRFILDHLDFFLKEKHCIAYHGLYHNSTTASLSEAHHSEQSSLASDTEPFPAIWSNENETSSIDNSNKIMHTEETGEICFRSFDSSFFNIACTDIPCESVTNAPMKSAQNLGEINKKHIKVKADHSTLEQTSSVDKAISKMENEKEEISQNIVISTEISSIPLKEVSVLGGVTNLEFILPNFAFSCALATQKAYSKPIDSSEIGAISLEMFICFLQVPHRFFASTNIHHYLLLRALLLFPDFLRYFLDKSGYTAEQTVEDSIELGCTWNTLLLSSPFSTADEFGHNVYKEYHRSLLEAYLERNHSRWNTALNLLWIHCCAIKLKDFYENLDNNWDAQILDDYRNAWKQTRYFFNVGKYYHIKTGEFSPVPILPLEFSVGRYDRLYQNRNQHNLAPSRPKISLRSNAFIVFLMTLCPWNEIDYSGLHSRAISITCLTKSTLSIIMREACQFNQFVVVPLYKTIRKSTSAIYSFLRRKYF